MSPSFIVALIVFAILAVAYLLMEWASNSDPLDVEQNPKDQP